MQVAVANGFLYAMGGHDCPASNPMVCRTETVERYDPATDTWTLVTPTDFTPMMPTQTLSLSLSLLDLLASLGT